MTSARHSKLTPRWGTPADYIAMARVALGGRIELDPMSEAVFNEVVGAERYWTERDDCFAQPHWRCETMLLNPAGGFVVEAWQRLTDEFANGSVRRAMWVGFSVEQLALLADRDDHPLDYSLLIPRQRLDFLTLHPRRSVVSFNTALSVAELECGHTEPLKAKSKKASGKPRIAVSVRCHQCAGSPESNGSPSHANYIVGLGIDSQLFESAFAGRGRFSHGRYAVRSAA